MARPHRSRWAPTIDRLVVRLVPAGDCWLWTGSSNGGGYGEISYNGRGTTTHRFMYEHFIADVPDGLVLDHLCRRTLCCNPWHLDPVPQLVNVLRGDGWAGRNARKTRCKRGHLLDDANVYLARGNQRNCRKCHALSERARRARLALAG